MTRFAVAIPLLIAFMSSSRPVLMVFSLLPPTSIPFSLPPLSPGQVLAARDVAARAGLPFFITEYNNGLGGALSRDDSGAAAFIFRQVSQSGPEPTIALAAHTHSARRRSLGLAGARG